MPGILHVCTANRCRSVIAERITRHRLTGFIPVTSAGVRARAGEPIWPEAAIELERRGVSALGFDSHPLTPVLVSGADLILTATRAHRDEVTSAQPGALRRTFTWRELAWLVDGLRPADLPGDRPAERLAVLAEVAGRRRGLRASPPPHLLDVDDPVGRPDGAVAAAAQQIEAALEPLLALLA